MCHIQSWFKTVYVTSETVNGVSEHILHRLLCKGLEPPLILLCAAREIENRWNAVNKAKTEFLKISIWYGHLLFFDTSWTLFLKLSGHVRTDSLLDSHPQVVTKRTADTSYRYNSSLKKSKHFMIFQWFKIDFRHDKKRSRHHAAWATWTQASFCCVNYCF